MSSFKQLLIGVVLIVMSQGVFANWKSGNELLANCGSEIPYMRGVCLGYILGVDDRGWGKTHGGLSYCTPKGLTANQLQKIVSKYLNDHPEELHYTADVLVGKALLKAFPCKAN